MQKNPCSNRAVIQMVKTMRAVALLGKDQECLKRCLFSQLYLNTHAPTMHPPIHLSIDPPIHLSIDPPIHRSTHEVMHYVYQQGDSSSTEQLRGGPAKKVCIIFTKRCPTALLPCPTALLPYRPTALPPYCPTTLLLIT